MACQKQNTVSHETLLRHGLKVNTKWQPHWKKRELTTQEKNTRCGNYENVDKMIYNWFIDKRSQDIRWCHRGCLCNKLISSFLSHLLFNWCTFSRRVTARCRWWRQWEKIQVWVNQNSGNNWYQIVTWTLYIIKEVLEFTNALGVTEFKASDCWLSNGNWNGRKGKLLAIFVLILNILTKYLQHFFVPEIFNKQGTCIPSPSPRLTSFPVIITLHSAHLYALTN